MNTLTIKVNAAICSQSENGSHDDKPGRYTIWLVPFGSGGAEHLVRDTTINLERFDYDGIPCMDGALIRSVSLTETTNVLHPGGITKKIETTDTLPLWAAREPKTLKDLVEAKALFEKLAAEML